MAYETMHAKILGDKITLCQIYKCKDDANTTGYWHYRFRAENKTIRASSRETNFAQASRVAEDHYLETIFKIRNGLPTSKKTFKKVFDEWLKSQDGIMSAYRVRLVKSMNANYFSKYFGKMKIDELTANKLDMYWPWRIVNSVRSKPSSATLRADRQALVQFLKWCVVKNYLKAVPDVSSPAVLKPKDTRRPAFTEEHLETLQTQATPYLNASRTQLIRRRRAVLVSFVMFGCLSGLRVSEIRYLKWKHVRFSDEIGGDVIIDLPAFRTVDGLVEDHKTGARTIVCMPEIKRWLWFRNKEVSNYQGNEDYVFPSETGGPCNLSQAFKAYMKYCGTETSPSGNNYTSYSTRHTYATNRILEHVGLAFLSENMGTGILNLQNHYGHILTEANKAELTKGHVGVAEYLERFDSHRKADSNADIQTIIKNGNTIKKSTPSAD